MPGQTGENHFNEQYPTYWVKKFNVHDYVFVDLLRPKFWNIEEIEWWYRQNMFIVLKKTVAEAHGFSTWDEKIHIIKDMIEMYVKTFNSTNASELFSTKALIKIIIDRFFKKAFKNSK